MSNRVRVVQYIVQPVLVSDDGTDLTPLQVDPLTVPAAEWAAFVETGLARALSELEASLNPTEDAASQRRRDHEAGLGRHPDNCDCDEEF